MDVRQAAIALSWGKVALAALVLLALMAMSPRQPIYDEAWYLDTLPLLARDGLSVQFLHDFPGAAGPTFTFVFAIVDKLFGLTLPWLRLVNAMLLGATALLLWRCLVIAQKDTTSPGLTAAMLTVLPTVGVSAGMALTEMPAVFFAMLSVTLLAQALASRGPEAAAWSISGGVALALAIMGRQNFLLMLPCLALAIRWTHGRPDPADTWRSGLLAAVAIALVTPVFAVWGGLVPPRTAVSTTGLRLDHVVRGAGYTGFIVLLLTPWIYAPLWRRNALLIAIAVATVPVAFLLDGFLPLRSALQALFGERVLVFVMTGTSLLLSFTALAFVACFTLHLWRYRDDWLVRMSGAFVLLGILSNAKITHQFSSRYVFILLPFIVMAAAPAMRLTWMTPLRMTSAAGISLAALASYYFAG